MTIYPSLNKSLKKNLHKIVDSTAEQSETQQLTEITFDVRAGYESFDFVGFRFTQPNILRCNVLLDNSVSNDCTEKIKIPTRK